VRIAITDRDIADVSQVSLLDVNVLHVEIFAKDALKMEPAMMPHHVLQMLIWNGQQLLAQMLLPLVLAKDIVYVTSTGNVTTLFLKCLHVLLNNFQIAQLGNIWDLQEEPLDVCHVIHLVKLAMMKAQLDV
jgi:hypothetical protein